MSIKENLTIEKSKNHLYFGSILEKYKDTNKNILSYKKSLLLNGDVLDKTNFENEIFDLIITSPPYNIDIKYNSHKDDLTYDEYLTFSEKWMRNCYNWTKKQGRFCLNIPLDKNKGGQRSVGADLTALAQKIGWKYHSTIIWNEGNISRRTAWGSWLSASAPYVIAPVELIVVLYKGEWKKSSGSKLSDISKEEFMEWTNGLWTFNGESKKRIGHPAPFPIELPYRCIKLFSFVDDLVFDPFAGSGTILIAANNTNRYSVGLEIDLKYCELAKQRIINETEMLF
ncbi:MAG TPA: site-specific DNA-methyltransferase [Spirochaetota bacterium]|nr:site-specific DNA-methyltransferase [Spirochaetota bacterium]HOL57946.1 site-specific DNA-methyltransferase [Spirochaetota bacterium]HPP05498.1 site-specific DNA-methyltransferase [Spirochaetota bacterium]